MVLEAPPLERCGCAGTLRRVRQPHSYCGDSLLVADVVADTVQRGGRDLKGATAAAPQVFLAHLPLQVGELQEDLARAAALEMLHVRAQVLAGPDEDQRVAVVQPQVELLQVDGVLLGYPTRKLALS
jgi:hypothetical protein